MLLPTRADVADRRASQFKERITAVLGEQDLAFFRTLVASYAAEQGKEPLEIAAALAYLAQQDRPLVPQAEPGRRRHEQQRDEGEGAPHRGRGRERAAPVVDSRRTGPGGSTPGGYVRYRVEVGREHGVQPGNIVGAIANEANIDSAHIGLIKIFDSHSTVDLPEGMPDATFQRLRKAWVCGQKLAISVDSPGSAPARPPAARRAERPHKRRQPK
jgi:ATP-dependent RNA helicase DeaD